MIFSDADNSAALLTSLTRTNLAVRIPNRKPEGMGGMPEHQLGGSNAWSLSGSAKGVTMKHHDLAHFDGAIGQYWID